MRKYVLLLEGDCGACSQAAREADRLAVADLDVISLGDPLLTRVVGAVMAGVAGLAIMPRRLATRAGGTSPSVTPAASADVEGALTSDTMRRAVQTWGPVSPGAIEGCSRKALQLKGVGNPARPDPQEKMEVRMRFLRPRRYAAALTGTVMALGLITVLAVAGTPASAATSTSSRISSSTATQEALISSTMGSQALAVAKAANAGYDGKTLISSPWGLHTTSITGRTCSSSTAHWFTLHINYDAGPNGWFYQCFGYVGTWYFPSNTFAWACAGNNHGTFSYYPISGGTDTFGYKAAWSSNFNSLSDVNYLYIGGWSGTYDCP